MGEQLGFIGARGNRPEQYPQPSAKDVFEAIRDQLSAFSDREAIERLVKGYLLQEKYLTSPEQLKALVDNMQLRVGDTYEHNGRGGGA